MDQLDRAVIAVLERLCGLAPATIENGVGGRHARCGGCVLAAHDSDQDIDRGPGVAPCDRADLGYGFRHFSFHAGLAGRIRKALCRYDR